MPHGQTDDPRLRRRRQACVPARRLQRPARRRQGDRRLAHPGRDSDHPLSARTGRPGRPGQPPRPARRQSAGRIAAAPGGRTSDPDPAPERPGHRRCPGRGHRRCGQAPATGRGIAAREPPLPPRRGERRPEVCRQAGLIRGPLCERCIRDCPSRACLDGRHRTDPACLRGPAHGARDHDPVQAPRGSRAAVRGDPRRGKGVRQVASSCRST